jgi:hypothetical protein
MGIRILLFLSLNFKMPTKNYFKKKFFCILLFEGTFTSFFKDKRSKRSHKAAGIKVLPYFFLLNDKRSGSIPLTNGSGSGSRRPKTHGSGGSGFGSGSATLPSGGEEY